MADALCFGLARQTTLHILRAAGFNRTRSSHAVDILTDVLVRFISLIGEAAHDDAGLCGRTQPTIRDMASCLEKAGIKLGELMDWVQLDGRELQMAEQPPLEKVKSIIKSGIYSEDDQFPVLQYEWITREDIDVALLEEELEIDAKNQLESEELEDMDMDINDDLFVPEVNGTTAVNGVHQERLEFAEKHMPPIPGIHLGQVEETFVDRKTSATGKPIVRRRRLINNPYAQAIPFEESQLSQDPASVELLKMVKAKESENHEYNEENSRKGIQDAFKAAYASLCKDQDSFVMLSGGDINKRLRLASAIEPDIYRSDTISGHIPGQDSLAKDLVLSQAPKKWAAKLTTATVSPLVPIAVQSNPPPNSAGILGTATSQSFRGLGTAGENITIVHGPNDTTMTTATSAVTLASRKGGSAKNKPSNIKTTASRRQPMIIVNETSPITTLTPKIKIKLSSTPIVTTPTITIKPLPVASTPPPASGRGRGRAQSSRRANVDKTPDIVNCVCTTPSLDDGSLMISCDKCMQWFHARCVLGPNVTAEQVDKVSSWKCPRDR